jgi:hypothetical protein
MGFAISVPSFRSADDAGSNCRLNRSRSRNNLTVDNAKETIVHFPVPDAVTRIANSEDRKLAWHFFILFSRMEYALKRSGRYLQEGTTDAIESRII